MLAPTPGEGTNLRCDCCGKDCPSRKSYVDHRRSVHGLYYVTHSGPFIIRPLPPIRIQLTLVLGQTFVLEKHTKSGSVQCHKCNTPINKSCSVIKAHYQKVHGWITHVDMRCPTGTNPRRAPTDGAPLPTPSPSSQNTRGEENDDSEMAEGSDRKAKRTGKGLYDEDAFPDVESNSEVNPDEDDRDQPAEDADHGGLWDDGSLDSDGEDSDEMVVPENFTLQGFAPPFEDDPPADEGQGDPPRVPEEGEHSHCNVYGSSSKRSDS